MIFLLCLYSQGWRWEIWCLLWFSLHKVWRVNITSRTFLETFLYSRSYSTPGRSCQMDWKSISFFGSENIPLLFNWLFPFFHFLFLLYYNLFSITQHNKIISFCISVPFLQSSLIISISFYICNKKIFPLIYLFLSCNFSVILWMFLHLLLF